MIQSRLYLLDTNTVTYLVTERSESIRERYLATERTARMAISALTEGEIRFGLERKAVSAGVRKNVEGFLSRATILPWNSEASAPYGALRARLQASGMSPGPLDILIAGHALALGATLVTHDKALSRLTAFLSVEDWHE